MVARNFASRSPVVMAGGGAALEGTVGGTIALHV